MAKMTLEFAIMHCLEATRREDLCQDCRDEHRQLADWLTELKTRREKDGIKSEMEF